MVALLVASGILVTGVRLLMRSGQVLVDQALPPDEVSVICAAIEPFAERGVVGYHELRTRQAGSQRYVDAHVQFRTGTSLEEAHRTAHELKDAIAAALGGADVLIHLEPADRVRPGEALQCPAWRPRLLEQVDRGGDGHRQGHQRVAVAASDAEHECRDQAGEHRHEPCRSGRASRPYSRLPRRSSGACTACRTG